MALWIEKNPTAFFSLVGAAYVPEHRPTYQGSGRTRHAPGLLAWLARDCAAESVEPLGFH